MLTVEQALARVMAAAAPGPCERVSLESAFGRVLGEDVTSPRDIPPWDNSAMDGFALRAADTSEAGGAPVILEVIETIAAGAVPERTVTPGTCSRIMTGAPVPPGADAVVMIERTSAEIGVPTDRVEIREVARHRQNIRPRGGDVATGQVVLRAGAILGAAQVGMLSSLGYPSVMVRQRPLVAVLSTGDEVIEAGWPLAPGQIYSSNTHSLLGLIHEAGAVGMHCGIAPDEPEGLRAALRRCLRADVILTTGGVSAGDFDFVRDAFGDTGASLDFWKVKMKPGKPLAFGQIGGVPAFGLPGNPVSCMVNFLQYVRPVLRTMLGDPKPFLPVVAARLAAPIRKKPGRAHMVRVTLEWVDGRLTARSTGTQSSGVLTSMVQADGLALLGLDDGPQDAGAEIRVQVLHWRWMRGAEPGYGW